MKSTFLSSLILIVTRKYYDWYYFLIYHYDLYQVNYTFIPLIRKFQCSIFILWSLNFRFSKKKKSFDHSITTVILFLLRDYKKSLLIYTEYIKFLNNRFRPNKIKSVFKSDVQRFFINNINWILRNPNFSQKLLSQNQFTRKLFQNSKLHPISTDQ